MSVLAFPVLPTKQQLFIYDDGKLIDGNIIRFERVGLPNSNIAVLICRNVGSVMLSRVYILSKYNR